MYACTKDHWDSSVAFRFPSLTNVSLTWCEYAAETVPECRRIIDTITNVSSIGTRLFFILAFVLGVVTANGGPQTLRRPQIHSDQLNKRTLYPSVLVPLVTKTSFYWENLKKNPPEVQVLLKTPDIAPAKPSAFLQGETLLTPLYKQKSSNDEKIKPPETMWELPNYDSVDIMPGIEPENTQLPVFVREPPVNVKVRRRNMTMTPNDVRLWPKYKRSKYRRERLNVGTETYNENNLQFTQKHAVTHNYMNTTNEFLQDSLIMQKLRKSPIRRFNEDIKPLRKDFLEMITPSSTTQTTSFPLFFITSEYLRKIKPNPLNEVVLLPRGFTFPTTTDEPKPTEFDISDTLNRFLEDVKKLAEEYYLVKRLKDSNENYIMKRAEKKAHTIVIMARADDESTTTSDASTATTKSAADENTTTKFDDTSEVKKDNTTSKDEVNEECKTDLAEGGANNKTAANKTMQGDSMEEVKPESTGSGEHNSDDKSCPEGKFFHLSKEALEKVELTTQKNESCGIVHCHSNTYTIYDEKLTTTKLKKSVRMWRNWRHTTYSPLRKSQIRSSRKKKMKVELQDDVEEINLYLRRTRSVEPNDSMIKELQEVLKDVESIKTGKTLSEGAIMSGECGVYGSWMSEMAGRFIDLNIDMTASLRKPILKNQLGFMGKMTWNVTFRRPFVSKKNYIILHAIQKKEKLFAIYMGECRVCRQREIIQGQWLVTRHSRDCEGLGATEQLVGDVWRKDRIQEMKRNRLKMLKDQAAELSPDMFSDETTTNAPSKSSI